MTPKNRMEGFSGYTPPEGENVRKKWENAITSRDILNEGRAEDMRTGGVTGINRMPPDDQIPTIHPPKAEEQDATGLAEKEEFVGGSWVVEGDGSTSAEKKNEFRSTVAKLLGITAAKEKIVGAASATREFFSNRSQEIGEKYLQLRNADLNKQIKALGKGAGESLMKTGEWYRKLPTKYKVAVSAALFGASFATGGASTLVTLLSAAKLGQRSLASLGTYSLSEALMEKRLARIEKEKGITRTKWDTWRKHGVAATAALAIFSGVPGHLLREGFEAGGGGKAVNWLGGVFGHNSPPAASPIEHSGAAVKISLDSPVVEGVGEAARATPTVSAVRGRGAEYMMKEMWRQLQGKNFNPDDYPDKSDIRTLLEAKPENIDSVVHKMAMDPKHNFFRPADASLRIDLDAQMTIDEHGQIFVKDSINGVQAPEDAHMTRPPHVETAPQETAGASKPATTAEKIVPDDVAAVAPPEPESSHPGASTVDMGNQGDVGAETPSHPAVEAAGAPDDFFHNKYIGDISRTEPHIYGDASGKHAFIYPGEGGKISFIEAQKTIQHYFDTHPKGPRVVYELSHMTYGGTKQVRIPWTLDEHGVAQKMRPIEPINKVRGIFASWRRFDGPEDFRRRLD